LIAPVALGRFDEMAREDLTGAEGDDGDLPFVDDGKDAATRVGRTDLEVVEAATSSQGKGRSSGSWRIYGTARSSRARCQAIVAGPASRP
jgi:hypothetical protein